MFGPKTKHKELISVIKSHTYWIPFNVMAKTWTRRYQSGFKHVFIKVKL